MAQATFKQKNFNKKTRTSKAIYNWLPAMVRFHKITPASYPSPLCNTCKKAPETQDPIFTCGHHESRKQQIKALKAVEREAKEAGINTFLIRTLMKGLHVWMHNLPPPKKTEKNYPVHILVRDAYAAQELLG